MCGHIVIVLFSTKIQKVCVHVVCVVYAKGICILCTTDSIFITGLGKAESSQCHL